MKTGKKKYIASIYYVGLVIGAIVMNYIILNYSNFAETLIENFQGLDKLSYINRKELYIYIFCKRLKQLAVFGMIYFYFSKILALLSIPFCFAFFAGLSVSLFIYYYGIIGLFLILLLFFPVIIPYGLLYYVSWMNFISDRKYSDNKRNIRIILLVALIIVSVFFEVCVNIWISSSFFNNK